MLTAVVVVVVCVCVDHRDRCNATMHFYLTGSRLHHDDESVEMELE